MFREQTQAYLPDLATALRNRKDSASNRIKLPSIPALTFLKATVLTALLLTMPLSNKADSNKIVNPPSSNPNISILNTPDSNTLEQHSNPEQEPILGPDTFIVYGPGNLYVPDSKSLFVLIQNGQVALTQELDFEDNNWRVYMDMSSTQIAYFNHDTNTLEIWSYRYSSQTGITFSQQPETTYPVDSPYIFSQVDLARGIASYGTEIAEFYGSNPDYTLDLATRETIRIRWNEDANGYLPVTGDVNRYGWINNRTRLSARDDYDELMSQGWSGGAEITPGIWILSNAMTVSSREDIRIALATEVDGTLVPYFFLSNLEMQVKLLYPDYSRNDVTEFDSQN